MYNNPKNNQKYFIKERKFCSPLVQTLISNATDLKCEKIRLTRTKNVQTLGNMINYEKC